MARVSIELRWRQRWQTPVLYLSCLVAPRTLLSAFRQPMNFLSSSRPLTVLTRRASIKL